METLRQYYKLTDIKPENKKLYKPIYGTSKVKIIFTLDEITLYYDKKIGGYVSNIIGGNENTITFLQDMF